MVDRLVSVDSVSNRLPGVVRQRLADDMADPSTEMGTRLSATFASQFTASAGTTVAQLNAWLAVPYSGPKRLAGNLTLTAPIVIPSNTTLDATGATITSAFAGHMLENTAVSSPNRSVTDAAITTGTNTVTSATANFTTADTGRSIVIVGAGPNGGMFDLTALLTYVNATTATLTKLDGTAANAGATVTAAAASIYVRDVNIKIVGGIWNRGSYGGTGSAAHSLYLRHLDKLTIDIDQFLSNSGGPKYAVQPGDVTEFDLRVRHFAHGSDGIHVRGPAARGVVHDVSGTTADDFVVFGASDNTRVSDGAGDISDIEIRSLLPSNLATNVVKLYGNAGTTIRRVRVDGVRGVGTKGIAIGATDIVGGTFDDVTVENVRMDTGSISVNGSGTSLRIRDAQQTDGKPGDIVNLFRLDASATWNRILLSSVDMPNVGSTASGGKLADILGIVGDLIIENANLPSVGAGALVQVEAGASITRLSLNRCVQVGGAAMVKAPFAATLGEVHYTDCYSSGADCLGDFATTTSVFLSNTVNVSSTGGALRLRATGNVTVLGAGASKVSGGIATAAGYAARVSCPGFSCDLALVTSKSNGDQAYNSNGALACGAGPVVSNGTNWKNLYTGATY